MSGESMIIIGAGLAGLSTGCYGQMNGYRTRIFEHHGVPGGVVAAWKRQGFTIDGGIHFVWGHKTGLSSYELYRELGILQANRFPELTSYCRFIHQPSGRSLEITRDLDRLAQELTALFPADARAVEGLVAGARAIQGSGVADLGMSKPPELTGALERVRQMWGMRRAFKYFSGNYARPVAEYVQGLQDPWLRHIVENLFLPDVPVWFVLMFLGAFADGQLGLPEGGSLNFVRPLEKRYKDLGGQVHYRSRKRHCRAWRIFIWPGSGWSRVAGSPPVSILAGMWCRSSATGTGSPLPPPSRDSFWAPKQTPFWSPAK